MSLPHRNPLEEHQSNELQITPPGEIRKSLAILFDERAIVELRAFGAFGDVVSGFYEDHDALARDTAILDRNSYQAYVTLNEIYPASSRRVLNTIVHKVDSTTADRDIIRRRWLPVDVDPVRPSGTSSTRQEKWAAYLRTKEIRDYLRGHGWREFVAADSGNGFYLLYPMELPNDEKSRYIAKVALEGLAELFDDEKVKVDTTVHNASRLVRLYGTMARKGEDTPKRPHRRSRLLKVSLDREAT